MISLVDKIVELHERFDDAEIPHAFGGALALAWCTQRARGTIDIDVNLFIGAHEADRLYAALPDEVDITEHVRADIERDGQTRLWWQKTPVDVFFNTTPFHKSVASRARIEQFGGQPVPFLACQDIAVFKAFFNRDKDWVDLAEMAQAATLDFTAVIGELAIYLGGDDGRVTRMRALALAHDDPSKPERTGATGQR